MQIATATTTEDIDANSSPLNEDEKLLLKLENVLEFPLGKETWDQGMLKALSANDRDLAISSIGNTASINSVSAVPSEF